MKTCKTCGVTWKGGEHGSHDCWEVKDARMAESEARNVRLRNALHRTVTRGGDWVPHQVIARDALEKE